MAKLGKFIYKNFADQKIMLYSGDQNDWFKYQDNDSMAYVLVVGTVVGYDEECGVLTMRANNGEDFFVSEYGISMFWRADSKFRLVDNVTSTIRSGKKWLKGMDIM